MSTCLKTGVDVFIEEYNASVRADIHTAAAIIINFTPNSWNEKANKNNCECHIAVGSGYMNKEKGIIVNPSSYIYHPKKV